MFRFIRLPDGRRTPGVLGRLSGGNLRTWWLGLGLLLGGCSGNVDDGLADGADPVASTAEAATAPCPSGTKLTCATSGGKFTCWCQTPPPPTKTYSVVPRYYITHVVYAPPGKGSEIEYSNTTSVGTTTSSSRGFKSEYNVTAEGSGSLLWDAEVTVTGGAEFGTTRSDSVDVSTTYTRGMTKKGQGDFVDHNYDEIWFLMKPKLSVTVQPPYANFKGNVKWKFGQQGTNNGVPMFVYAGWLNNAMQMPSNVRATLDAYGITPDQYSTLLAADPLFTGVTPNMTMDPARFEHVDRYAYNPRFAENDEPSTQSYSVEHSTTNTTGMETSRDYSVGLSIESGVDFSVLRATLKADATWTWSNSYGTETTNASGSTDSFTLVQPEFDYTGPTLVNVYFDKVYKTYAFTLDYPQGEKNLALGRDAWQSTDAAGYEAHASRATDGNTDGNFFHGSVTHTEAGFTNSGYADAPGQYWAVDLGSERIVNSVRIFNRTDCCSERLSHYNILAWDNNVGWKVISNHSGDSTAGVSFLNWPINMVRTRFVMIAKTDDNSLQLAEVQVMGF